MDSEFVVNQPDILLLGPYGSGKSSVAKAISVALNCTHFDAGDELRRLAASTDSDAVVIRDLMAKGELVPVRFTVGQLERRMLDLPHARFIIDGTPRSLEQLEEFDRVLRRLARRVQPVLLAISDETSLRRQVHRACDTCGCQEINEAGACSRCGSPRHKRHDSSADVAAARIANYYSRTVPVIEQFRERGLAIVSAEGPLPDVCRLVLEILSATSSCEGP